MGWDPFDDIKDAVSSGWDSIKDAASDTWEHIKDGDIGALLEDAFHVGTLGLFKLAGDWLDDKYGDSAPEQDFKSRKHSVRDAANLRNVIYGKVRTGGQYVYLESSGADDAYLHLIIVFAAHPCNKIKTVYFGDKIAIQESGAGYAAVAPFSGKLDWHFEHGRQTGASSYVLNMAPSSWTANHKLLGQTYAYFRLKYDDETYSKGIPNITAIIEGKDDIYDPRVEVEGYTDNQGLCLLDYLRWDRGFAAADTEIDMGSFIRAADIADEDVFGPRYTVNGSFRLGSAPLDILQSLARAGASYPFYTQGKWSVAPGAYQAPVMSFDESDLVGGLSFQTAPGRAGRHNIAKGTYVSPEHNYEPVDFVQIAVDSYIAEDLEELDLDLQLPFTNSGTMARRLAKIAVERSRFGLSASVALKHRAIQVTPGDRISLSIERLGWNHKVFRVEQREYTRSSGIKLDLREDSPEIYSWSEGENLVVEAPPALNLPDGLSVTPPTSLSTDEELYIVAGQARARALFSWRPGGVSTTAYDAEYRSVGGEWTRLVTGFGGTSTRVEDMTPGEYQFRVRAINGIGIHSDWAEINVAFYGKTAPPSDVTDLRITVNSGQILLSWPAVHDLDLSHYRVRYNAAVSGVTWSNSQDYAPEVGTTQLILPSQRGTYLVKAVDGGGQESANAVMAISEAGQLTEYNVVEVLDEAPEWSGDTQSVTSTNGTLQLGAADPIAAWSPLADVISMSYGVNGLSPTGIYAAARIVDLGHVYTSRLSAEVLAAGYDILATIASWDPLADVARMDLSAVSQWDVGLDVSFSTTPAPSAPGSWSEWEPLHVGEYTARAFRFRLRLDSYAPAITPRVSLMRIVVDMPDRVASGQDIECPAGGMRVLYPAAYIARPSLAIDAQGLMSGDYKVVSNRDTEGFDLQFLDASGTGVTRTFDYLAKGYGRRSAE